MALTSGFFISKNRDRTYDNDVFSEIFDGIINDGVFASVGTFLSTTPHSGMSVTIGVGRAWFNQTWTFNSSPYIITFSPSDNIMPRIDTVVLEVNKTDGIRDNSLKIITGIPSINPVPPTLNPPEKVFWHPISNVTIRKQTEEITVNDIDVLVGKDACPFVTGLLETVSIESLFEKWTNDFENWLEHLKNELDENQAANLQNQIDHILNGYGEGSDSGSQILLTVDNFSLVAGATVRLRLKQDILENATLNVNNTGDIPIKYSDGSNLVTGDYLQNGYLECTYNGTVWQVKSPRGNTVQVNDERFMPKRVYDNIFIESASFAWPPGETFFGDDEVWYCLGSNTSLTNIELIRARDKASINVTMPETLKASVMGTNVASFIGTRNQKKYIVLFTTFYPISDVYDYYQAQKILIPVDEVEKAIDGEHILNDIIIEYSPAYPTLTSVPSSYARPQRYVTYNTHQQCFISIPSYSMFVDVNVMINITSEIISNPNWSNTSIGKEPNTLSHHIVTADTTNKTITNIGLKFVNVLTGEQTGHTCLPYEDNIPLAGIYNLTGWTYIGYMNGYYILYCHAITSTRNFVAIRESDWKVFHTWSDAAFTGLTTNNFLQIYSDNTILVGFSSSYVYNSLKLLNILTGEVDVISFKAYTLIDGFELFKHPNIDLADIYYVSSYYYKFNFKTKTLTSDNYFIKIGRETQSIGVMLPASIINPEIMSELDGDFRIFEKAALLSYEKELGA